MKKVQLILVDGMRPDGLLSCGSEYVQELLGKSLYTMKARTVMPSVTLPCHMSLFHSVDPTRHGIATNTYTPQVRPIEGICEMLRGRKCGIFYNWEEIRDLSRPGNLAMSAFYSGRVYGYDKANQLVTDAAIQAMKELGADFTFTYLGWTDSAGHAQGWMGDEYMRSIRESFLCIQKLIENAPEGCVTIIVADHGGHDRTHGTEMDEDMLIPVIIHGAGQTGEMEGDVSIKDIAPTIVKLLDRECAPEWEGHSLL